MKLRLLISLNLLLALPAVHAQQTADDYFHGGAISYLSNNIPHALAVVTNGRAIYPEDSKLKKLEELLKQQQQQNQQQQQQQENQDKQKQEQQQSKNDQQKQQPPKQDKQKTGQPQPAQAKTAGQMTPEEAKRLLDAQKGEEEALVFKPQGKPEKPEKPVKDW